MNKPMSKSRFGAQRGVVSLLVVAGLALTLQQARANAPANRYVVASGTVKDTQTLLVWQQVGPTSTTAWSNATAYCKSGTALPGSGWRLPTLTELQTLIDDSQNSPPLIDPTAFPQTAQATYWTSSADANNAGAVWYVDFSTGFTQSNDASAASNVRCVR